MRRASLQLTPLTSRHAGRGLPALRVHMHQAVPPAERRTADRGFTSLAPLPSSSTRSLVALERASRPAQVAAAIGYAPTPVVAAASPVPSLATALLGTSGPVLVIAPRCGDWADGAPANITFLSTGISRDELIARIAREKPLALVVGDQPVDAGLIEAWRAACPHDELVLLRRGSSVDKIDVDACRRHGVEVVNTPGVNAPYVAAYALEQLRLRDGRCPDDVRLIGLGHVGRELIKQLCKGQAKPHVSVAVRTAVSPRDESLAQFGKQLSTTNNWDAVFAGGSAVAICVSINDSTTGCISGSHIAGLKPDARIVCVSKPDVFSDEALMVLATRPDVALVVDYGAATLDAFRRRLTDLGIPAERWARPPELTTKAATGEACKRDLDHAVAVALATRAVDRFVARRVAEPMVLPTVPSACTGPLASVVGCGVNGLLQAFMLRCLGWQVDVYGGDSESDGASHKNINMRQLSATETTAKPVANAQLHRLNNELVIRFNQGSIELFGKLLDDNPRFRQWVGNGVVRAFPEGVAHIDRDAAFQCDIARRDAPSGRAGVDGMELSRQEFVERFGVPAVAKALELPGYDLAFRDFMAELKDALEAAGVNFLRARLSKTEIRDLGAQDSPVITAMGVADEGVVPIVGWFFRIPAAGGEGAGFRGLKLQYPLPVGVMNCRCDGDDILVSGGQVPHDAGPDRLEEIKGEVFQAIARHFPLSFAHARRDGSLEMVTCARPGVLDGMSRIEQTGPHHTMVGGTYAGGMTQGVLLAALATERLAHPMLPH